MPKVASKNLIGYKGFDKDWKCQSKQYKPDETFKHKGVVRLCNSGLHFCLNPFDVLNYYPLVGSHFTQVEAKEVSEQTDSDSKRVAKELHIGAELTLDAFIKAGFKFVYDSVDWKKAKDSTSATSGDYAHSATSGNGAHSATSGYGANSATSGNDANSATSGYDANSATSGYDAHSATSGNRANSATSGYGAHSATSGVTNAIACAIGRKAKAKADKGCFIVLAEWYEGKNWTDAKPIAVKSAVVDGKTIKADQWYKLVDGEFTETDDHND